MNKKHLEQERVIALIQEFRNRIAVNGVTFMQVGSGPSHPPFVYSIGLCKRSMPEMLMIGNMPGTLCQTMIADVIAAWSQYGDTILKRKVATPSARSTQSQFPLHVKVRLVDRDLAHKEYVCWVSTVCPEENTAPSMCPVVQILWPDPDGIYPDEPGYSTDPLYDQPLLPEV